MGYAKIGKWSWRQLDRHIRNVAKDSSSVFVTKHAAKKMLERKIPSSVMHTVLKKGVINRQPEQNDGKGNLECRMEHYCAGQTFGVIVAVCDEDPTILIVTVMQID